MSTNIHNASIRLLTRCAEYLNGISIPDSRRGVKVLNLRKAVNDFLEDMPLICVRCGAYYRPDGRCGRFAEGCQGGIEESI